MTEKRIESEPEEFGKVPAWRLLNRRVVDGVKISVNVMTIQGRGVLIQTDRNGVVDQPLLLPNLMLLEYEVVTPSSVKKPDGSPFSISHQIVARDLFTVDDARDKFQRGKADRDKRRERLIKDFNKAQDGSKRSALEDSINKHDDEFHFDRFEINAGTLLTSQVTPEEAKNA